MRIAFVGAHLDDIEISCGGMVADLVERGHEVRMVAMTPSGYTNLELTHFRSDATAIAEGKEAADVLGVGAENLKILFMQNMDVPAGSEGVHAVERELIDHRAELVVAHHTRDSHQDHRQTGFSVLAACRRMPNVLLFEPISPQHIPGVSFNGAMYWPVSNRGMSVKLDALRAHWTEYQKYGGERWLNAITGQAVAHGYRIGVDYAEAYEVVRWRLDAAPL